MSIFSQITLAFKSPFYKADVNAQKANEPFFIEENGLTSSRQHIYVSQVANYLNHSQPACLLYQQTLEELTNANQVPVKEIKIKIVSDEEAPTGGKCNVRKNLIMVNVNETDKIDEKTKHPLVILAETILFELGNLSHSRGFQKILNERNERIINEEQYAIDYAIDMEKEERKTQPIVASVIVNSMNDANKKILENTHAVSAKMESAFWSFMVKRFSDYQCNLLTRPLESIETISQESMAIYEGIRSPISAAEIEQIHLEIQYLTGHTQSYHYDDSSELDDYVANQRNQCNNDGVIYYDSSSEPDDYVANQRNQCNNDGVIYYDSSSEPDDTTAQKIEVTSPESNCSKSFSDYQCNLLTRPLESIETISQESMAIYEGIRSPISAAEIEQIHLEIQYLTGHTQSYHYDDSSELDDYVANQRNQCNNDGVIYYDSSSEPDDYVANQRNQCNNDGVIYYDSSSEPDDTTAQKIEVTSPESNCSKS